MSEWQLPDYNHGSVNLMASLSLALGGGASGYQPLSLLPPGTLHGRPVILLLIDGLGTELLQRYPESFLARHTLTTLSAVFPSTTASAVTSFATGVAPQQHAITGWHLWLRELGSVATILPFVPRHGGAGYGQAGFSPSQFIGSAPLFDRLNVPVEVLSPEWIVHSDYTRATSGNAPRHGYRKFDELLQKIGALVADGAPRFVYGYWAELDSLAHEFGANSHPVVKHLLAMDAGLATLAQTLGPSGALLLITADHGLLDTDGPHTLYVHDHPPLAEALTLPLCGEPRTAFCYLRPRQEQRFLAYVRGELGHCCEVVESGALIAQGFFGFGTPHPELEARVGDYTLLMKENYVIRQRLPFEKPFRQIGVHGGLSRAEMRVPLIKATP
ncbi:MAG TPA: alkaline phosphatase family protein [Gammaproteobacteria bacterium]